MDTIPFSFVAVYGPFARSVSFLHITFEKIKEKHKNGPLLFDLPIRIQTRFMHGRSIERGRTENKCIAAVVLRVYVRRAAVLQEGRIGE